MPTTLFVEQQHHAPFGPGGDYYDGDVHYLHHQSKALYIISEHEYGPSLIPHADRAASVHHCKSPRRLQTDTSLRHRPQHTQPHPLMATLTYTQEANMAIGAPGSPPDLTNSKSSKSSSFHSSNLSDVMGPNDLSHFEDINLDEAPRNPVLNGRTMSHPQVSTQHSFRDLTGGKSRYSSMKGQGNGAARQQSQLGAPGRTLRRGFTSPSAPSLANMANLSAPGRQNRSRSPSPSNPSTFPSAPRTLSRRSSRNLDVVSQHSSLNGRRQSWQHPARKTAKEREAECDDEDDEVPEELMMWNVPISPRPAQERSPAASACNSPPRTSPSPATSRPVSQNSVASFNRGSPVVPQKPFRSASPNPSNKENKPPGTLTRARTNTWEDTYLTLDDDAKKVTEALEEYQSGLEKKQEIERQQPGLSRSSSVEKTTQPTKSKLPPLRKSDPLVDPFQPSAEKEKHLSRTRPSWLPPKDPKEEKKHLKEYARIQAQIQKSLEEQKKKDEDEKLVREQVGRKKADLWEKTLLPKFATEVATSQGRATYRQLWWSGIPPKTRGSVWKTAIGNELEISETTFKVALAKAHDKITELGDRALDGKVAVIVENTKSVFPELRLFGPISESGEAQPFHTDLVNVCLAYSLYRPDVDTLSGIHHIAGLFLLNMSPAEAFQVLANLLNRPLPLSFLVRDQTAINAAYNITLSTLSQKAPSLAQRLAELRVEPHDYLRLIFSSLFCDRLPVEHAARFMDVYAIEGDKIATRAAVGYLSIREGKLYQGNVNDVVRNINAGAEEITMHPDDFMAKVYEAGKSA